MTARNNQRQQTTNNGNKQQTTNNKQQTTNNKQQTTNNKQQTTNNDNGNGNSNSKDRVVENHRACCECWLGGGSFGYALCASLRMTVLSGGQPQQQQRPEQRASG
jgi:hypothetical protein